MKLKRTRTVEHEMLIDNEDAFVFRNSDWYQCESGYCYFYLPARKRPTLVHRHLMAGDISFLAQKKRVPRHRIHIHHRNGIKNDNRKENLEALLDTDHRKLHAKQRAQSGKPLPKKRRLGKRK